ARRHRKADAGAQGRDDPRAGQYPAQPHARSKTVRLHRAARMSIETGQLAEVLRAAARAEIVPRFRRLGDEDIKQKTSPTDLVTEADTEAEFFIKREVEKRWPGTLVVG